MTATSQLERLQIVAQDSDALRAEFARDVAAGLAAAVKRLSCRYLYDREGSQLFEQICELPEYYLTRIERRILTDRADEIIGALPREVTLVELGSGSAAKTRVLIAALLRRQRALTYVPVDISPTALEESSHGLLRDFPSLAIEGVAAKYEEGLRRIHNQHRGPKLVLWLGSNVGNLDRAEAARFLARVRETLEAGDRLLLGIDMRKEGALLEAAYDDARGVTARFNLNLLRRINRELGGRFDLSQFRHRAVYNEPAGRVEMYLDSLRSQTVRLGALGQDVQFEAGEAIHTENSYKYSPAEIEELGRQAGLRQQGEWRDADGWFTVALLSRDDE